MCDCACSDVLKMFNSRFAGFFFLLRQVVFDCLFFSANWKTNKICRLEGANRNSYTDFNAICLFEDRQNKKETNKHFEHRLWIYDFEFVDFVDFVGEITKSFVWIFLDFSPSKLEIAIYRLVFHCDFQSTWSHKSQSLHRFRVEYGIYETLSMLFLLQWKNLFALNEIGSSDFVFYFFLLSFARTLFRNVYSFSFMCSAQAVISHNIEFTAQTATVSTQFRISCFSFFIFFLLFLRCLQSQSPFLRREYREWLRGFF